MNIYFILIFVGVGLYYIMKSVNLPQNRHKSNLFADLKLDEAALNSYTRYVSMYYLIIGILLIVFPFVFALIGALTSLIVGGAFIGGAFLVNNKRHALMAANK